MLFVKRPSQTLVVVEASYVRLEAQDWAHIYIYIIRYIYIIIIIYIYIIIYIIIYI